MFESIMDWFRDLQQMDEAEIRQAIQSYAAYGPLPGILLPFLEAFLAFLPLFVFIAVNANVYGLGLGILYSWIGVCLGAFSVFWIARLIGRRPGIWLQRRFPATRRFFRWIERKGFTPIFLLACFPFAPSFLVNLASGLSTVRFGTFALAILMGKAVMIFSVSFLSFDITQLAHQPWRIVTAVVVIAAMWFGGKKLESRYLSRASR
ncbi:MAG: TVP38/TMEM64 family protein [Thermobacillus sp.]|jgi:uncharacterized membrane protein YdjX (TVP38/TMEM64 family)|uniref:TVP38/TMEM64 family membrane protein n=2 Tax=Thermobacillus TaxID=76632 RepID=L0EAS1_THECK|nr:MULTISPECIES: TVP38/TMEM64 family protein [Thermobacillus]AGA56744.1 hypothetical protein Theco_0534 [Thermobacillus composti KWC4]REJ18843.1 MAG: TVP38/TMEM64 family protein [Paenibacillaceae bacterium]REK53642.1 MAG: TVP38/TMEM64 family protein [Thermobacillus sp.]CAG5076542.1 uncharacterizd protein YhjE [Thermobacillus xylanilyticus]